MRVTDDYDLSVRNTFGMRVRCRRFVECDTTDDVAAACAMLRDREEPWLVIGAGSNILFTGDYGGTVVHVAVKGIAAEETDGDVLVSAGGGEVFDDVVARCVAEGRHGLENLSGIPGEAGASAVQNIGAYGVEAGDMICAVEAVETATGRPVTLSGADCGYGYRHSRFKDEWKGKYVVTRVTYRLTKTFIPHTDYGNIRERLSCAGYVTDDDMNALDAQTMRRVITALRREKLPDPKTAGNAGSFFTNPIVSAETAERMTHEHPGMPCYPAADGRRKLSAAWMIDRCGWRGRTVGRAGVHDRQALVIVNRGGAAPRDILAVCRAVQDDVRRTFGITLTPEVNII